MHKGAGYVRTLVCEPGGTCRKYVSETSSGLFSICGELARENEEGGGVEAVDKVVDGGLGGPSG